MISESEEQCSSSKSRGIFRVTESLTWLSSPGFALMALLTLYYDNARNALCGSSGTPWNGMATMYLLIFVAHLSPWLTLLPLSVAVFQGTCDDAVLRCLRQATSRRRRGDAGLRSTCRAACRRCVGWLSPETVAQWRQRRPHAIGITVAEKTSNARLS
jgi:hypothetical protein